MRDDLCTLTGIRFAAVSIKELQSDRCYCGAPKHPRQTFCYADYRALPIAKRQALHSRIGGGYEEAYKDARKYLSLSRLYAECAREQGYTCIDGAVLFTDSIAADCFATLARAKGFHVVIIPIGGLGKEAKTDIYVRLYEYAVN